MTERPQYHDLIARNRRATWVLGAAFFLLLAAVASIIAYSTGGGWVAVIIGVVMAGVVTSVSYVSAAPLALSSTGAKPAPREQYAQLHNIVEGVSIAAGIPVPAVYVVDDPAPNAFATGRRPEQAAVAATTGLLEKMTRDELEGVMAHEVAHIRNQDIRVMTLAVATAGSIAIMTDIFWRMLFFGGARRQRGNDNGGNVIVVIGMVVVTVLAPIAAAMLKAAVSRRREALADATAVEITRYPTGLRRALEKLDADTTVVSRTSHATSHLWIESPDDHDPDHRGSRLNDMFDTHPPLRERIDLLRRIEGIDPYEGPSDDDAADTAATAEHEFTPAGWYVDPGSTTGRHRYWDGDAWTDNVT